MSYTGALAIKQFAVSRPSTNVDVGEQSPEFTLPLLFEHLTKIFGADSSVSSDSMPVPLFKAETASKPQTSKKVVLAVEDNRVFSLPDTAFSVTFIIRKVEVDAPECILSEEFDIDDNLPLV